MNTQVKQQGFTLIELLVTIAILAILAAIAYPTYEQYIQRSRIENTRSIMTNVIHHMEKVYANRSTFCETGSDATNNCATDISAVVNASPSNTYNITMSHIDGNRFILQAEPKSGVYSSDKMASKPLQLVYDSSTTTFARCNSNGFDDASQFPPQDPGTNCEVF